MTDSGHRRRSYESYVSSGQYLPPTADPLGLCDFRTAPCLTTSEAYQLCSYISSRRLHPPPGNAERLNDYFAAFARVKDMTMLRAVEMVLREWSKVWGFEEFERAQLGTLFPRDAEEAKIIIPSLQGKITDEDLQELLDEINKLRSQG